MDIVTTNSFIYGDYRGRSALGERATLTESESLPKESLGKRNSSEF